jgi:hypothetical protein
MFEMPGTGVTSFVLTAEYAKSMFEKSKMSMLKVA